MSSVRVGAPDDVRAAASIVFDLDGTLLDGDSTSAWMIERIRGSRVGTAVAIAAAPFAALLMAHSASRRLGASAFLWIASVGQDEDQLRGSFRAFAARANRGEGPVAWRPLGLEALRRHIEQGERVAVATAAPAWLAELLIEGRDLGVTVVGFVLAPSLRGWVGRRHCRHEAKCEALAAAGHGRRWAVAYSDSLDDLPLLARADQARLVNGSPALLARLAKGGVTAEPIHW